MCVVSGGWVRWATGGQPRIRAAGPANGQRVFEPTLRARISVPTFSQTISRKSIATDRFRKTFIKTKTTHHFDGRCSSHQHFQTARRAHDLVRRIRGKCPVFTTTFWRGWAGRGEGSMLPGQLLWKPSRCHRKIVFKSQQENPVKAVQTERDSKKDSKIERESKGERG